ncbi:MAG: glycerophosphodiester phosphodiesterase family protein [Opitutae bacterium]|nr:glycerophosphodiester phosphodiesterase family protein [Opitutae bacterium]
MNTPRCLVLSMLALGGTTVTAAPSTWTIAGNIAPEKVVVQSHRGAGVLAEENTVAAFELGWKLGTYPESDLRTTKDGVIVTFHDSNFKRVVKNVSPELASKGVKDLTYAELMKLDVGAWMGEQFQGRRVSKLADAFAAMRGKPERHLYLDIKNVDFPQLAQEVKAYGVGAQIVLASSKPEEIRAWKKLVPESDTLLWMRGSEADLRKRLAALRETEFSGITQIQIHIFPLRTIADALEIAAIGYKQLKLTPEEVKASPHRYQVSDAFVRELGDELRARGILFQALPYTTDANIYDELLDLGVMSFATDHPDVTMQRIKAYCARKAPASAAK